MNRKAEPASLRRDGVELVILLALGAVFVIVAQVLDPNSGPGVTVAVIGVLASLALVWLFHRRRGDSWAVLGLTRPKSWPRTVGWALGATVAIFVIAVTIQQLVLNPLLAGEQPDVSRFDSLEGNLPRLLGTLVGIWITAALAEEVVYRGFMMGRLANILGNSRGAWIGALVFSSLIFALLHVYQGVAGVAITGVVGFLLGCVYLLTRRNLWVGILAHGLIDTVSLTLVYLGFVG